mmetsp:Transcript_19515/g.55524  ORF Transcript_19515/g.55524 Transcript_19515/m.55524 type:complete len:338 (+) Transcript_19515:49-1062(+)
MAPTWLCECCCFCRFDDAARSTRMAVSPAACADSASTAFASRALRTSALPALPPCRLMRPASLPVGLRLPATSTSAPCVGPPSSARPVFNASSGPFEGPSASAEATLAEARASTSVWPTSACHRPTSSGAPPSWGAAPAMLRSAASPASKRSEALAFSTPGLGRWRRCLWKADLPAGRRSARGRCLLAPPQLGEAAAMPRPSSMRSRRISDRPCCECCAQDGSAPTAAKGAGRPAPCRGSPPLTAPCVEAASPLPGPSAIWRCAPPPSVAFRPCAPEMSASTNGAAMTHQAPASRMAASTPSGRNTSMAAVLTEGASGGRGARDTWRNCVRARSRGT